MTILPSLRAFLRDVRHAFAVKLGIYRCPDCGEWNWIRNCTAHVRAEHPETGVLARNRRIIEHELNTPMRGHDADGECCRRAAWDQP